MNTDIIEGKWKQLKGSAQAQWGKITDDDLDQIDGNAENLAGIIQQKYGKTREEAEKAINEWQSKEIQ